MNNRRRESITASNSVSGRSGRLCYPKLVALRLQHFLTLLVVPVLYSIFVLDLKLIQWETPAAAELTTAAFPYSC